MKPCKSRCEERFNTGEMVGAVQCTRPIGHTGKHRAPAPWGMVDWELKKPGRAEPSSTESK